ncbi:MAG: DNA-formamidopyrimidine glycosylase [Bacilli bacterium]
MPELPEVETVRRTLLLHIIDKPITNIDIRYSGIIKNATPQEFREKLINQSFISIKRRGKYLIFVLNDYYLVSHLRMEGKFFLCQDNNFSAHDHVIFYFSGENLRYRDERKFGVMYIFSKDQDIDNIYPLVKVGKEPWDITPPELYQEIKNRNVAIKTILLNQEIIAGMGNIYVDEVLFRCRLNPQIKAKNITLQDCQNIIENAKRVMDKAISLGGTTIRSFESSMGITGRFQNELLIHTKSICPVCGTKVKKIRVGGRGTYYCPLCQTEPNQEN